MNISNNNLNKIGLNIIYRLKELYDILDVEVNNQKDRYQFYNILDKYFKYEIIGYGKTRSIIFTDKHEIRKNNYEELCSVLLDDMI